VNGLPGVTGAVALDSANSYVLGNRIYIKVVGAVPKGGLAVYVAGSGNVPDGAVLTNDTPFTGVVVPPVSNNTPDAPFPSYDPVTRVLTFQHALGTSELEYNRYGGTFTAYAPIQVDDSSHNAGEWKARVKAYAAGNRTASGTADSPAIAAKTVTVNQIPVVSAGQQITIQLPTNSVALMGSGSDPDPGDSVVSWAWRPVLGPNTPTGLPGTTQNLVVSNLIEGTYQIGLRGTDTHGAQSNEAFTVITVNAANALTVSAPSVAYNSATRQLSAQHNLAGQLLYSYKGSAFTAYTGAIQVDGARHDAGDWQFKRAASSGYQESPAAGSPAIAQATTTTSTEIDLMIEGHSMAQYPNDYTEFQQPLVDKVNATFAANGFPNRIGRVRNVAHSGDRLLGGASGMVAQYDSQVKGTSVADKINVLVLFWLTNELSNQVYLDGTPGVASQATYAAARAYVRQCKIDDPTRLIVSELLTPRTNPGTPQPGFENERVLLNNLIKQGMASGDYPIDAIAPIGEDVRKLQPGPNLDGSGSTFYFDWVHASQQSNDIIESRYFCDAIVHAVQPSFPAPVPFTGTNTSNLYLTGAQKPTIAAQTGGILQTTSTSGIYNVASGGAYGDWSRDALLDLKMPAGSASKIGSKTPGQDALNVIWGLTFTNSVVSGGSVYDKYVVSFYRHEDGRLRYREGGSGEYQVGPAMSLSEWPLFAKSAAGVLSVVSTADGISFTQLVTFTGDYSADCYAHMAVEASLGKAYAPQGFGLVAAGAVVGGAAPGPYSGALTLSDSANLALSGTTYTSTTRGTWDATGRCTSHKIAAGTSGGISMAFLSAGVSNFAIIGLDESSTRTSYDEFDAGFWFADGSLLKRILNGVDSSTGVAPVAGKYRLWRYGSTGKVYIQQLVNATWGDVVDTGFASMKDLFMKGAIAATGRIDTLEAWGASPI
jgi:hypothetical protein